MIKRGRENGVFVRLGSSNRQADTALREEISRGILGKTFDEYPLVQATINEMELSEIEHIAESQHVELRKVLSTLNLIDTIQGNTVPTYGAYLLFGRNRLRFFPDAWIQCGRFVGLTKTHILDYVDLRNPFHQALYEVIDFLKKHAYLEPQISLLKRKDQWSIPLEILREAIINAIIHADFSQRGAPIRISFFDNRIEVENPGILLPGLTIEDIKHGISKTRNPVIARVFRELGFIEQWGSGIPRMIAFAQNNDWPEPEFSEIGTRFRATIFFKKSHATQTVLPKAQSMAQSMAQSEHILMLLTSTSLSAAEIASLLGLKSKSGGFKRSLKQLLEENLIEYTIASKPNSRLQKYRLSSKGKETIKEMKQK